MEFTQCSINYCEGIRSDSDLYTFGFPWRPWNEQTSIAEGPLIIKYVQESAQMYGIDKKIQFNHKVDRASWSTNQKSWSFDVTADGTTKKTLRSRFMLLCTGYYNYHEPLVAEIPGIHDFTGPVVHPQFWPKDLDYTGKNVVIIGSGATAVTLLPSMTDKASHVTMLQRSPSYLLSQPKEDGLEKMIRKWFPLSVQHKLIRWKWLLVPFMLVNFCYYFPKAARKMVRGAIQPQLPKSMQMDPNFNPSYFPFEQRMCFCPDGDFYGSLRSGKGSIETGVIEMVTPNSIKLKSGKELNPDIIVTATGLRLQIAGGMKITVDGQPINPSEKFIWKGVMLEDVPNSMYVLGYVDASWTLGADATAQMGCRMLKQMQKEKAVEVVPRRSEKEKREMKEKPVLRLTSTYIKKASDVLPKAGDSGQWRPRSFYFKDMYMAWFGDLKTGAEWIRGV